MPLWCPRSAGRPATSSHLPGARRGPSSSRRWRAPAPAAPPSGQRQRPATAKLRCGGDRERARRGHRPMPWPCASRPSGSSSTPAAGRLRRIKQPVVRLLACAPVVNDRHQLGYQRHGPGPVVLQRVHIQGAAALARQYRTAQPQAGPGTDTRSPAWRPTSSPQRGQPAPLPAPHRGTGPRRPP